MEKGRFLRKALTKEGPWGLIAWLLSLDPYRRTALSAGGDVPSPDISGIGAGGRARAREIIPCPRAARDSLCRPSSYGRTRKNGRPLRPHGSGSCGTECLPPGGRSGREHVNAPLRPFRIIAIL